MGRYTVQHVSLYDFPVKSNRKGHGIPFNPVSQHVKNTGITLTCYQCERPRLVYCKKKVLQHIVKKFKKETNDLLFTWWMTIEEIVDKPSDYDFLIHVNLTCQILVEALYYSVNYKECCAHCRTTWRLCKSKEAYPICFTYVVVHERKVVAKKKAPVSKNPKKWNLQLTEVCNIPSFVFKNMS